MSVDRSLKSRSALSRHRNVLTRAERLDILNDEGRWDEQKDSVFGLPKVAHRKSIASKKTSKKDEAAKEGEAAATPVAATTSAS
jgi:small basic protein (TIGR04137 family)